MNELCNQYIQNINKVRALSKPSLSADMSQEQILQCIHENALQMHDLRIENDAILESRVFSRVPELMSPEEVENLKDFANQLFRYNRSLDVGTAYRIHQLLYAYAQYKEDRNLIIRELYFQGLTLHYMNLIVTQPTINLYCKQIGDYFTKGAAYMAQYEEIEDEETRGYIIRCLGNRKLGMYEAAGTADPSFHTGKAEHFDRYEQLFRETMAVINSPKYRAMNPNLPWDQYEYSMHLDRTTFLAALRNQYDERIAKAVLESAEFSYRYQLRAAKERDKIISERIVYIYIAARYHAGLIPLRELTDAFLALCNQARADDFSSGGIFLNLRMPLYLHHYVNLLPKEEAAAYMPQVNELLDHGLTYLLSLPQNEYASMISSAVGEQLRIRLSADASFQYRLLDYVLACHAPTYIHSLMVANLTEAIAARFLNTQPSLLIGILDTETEEEVLQLREEICLHAYRCGLYHDLGKCQMLHEVSIYDRRLLNEEYRHIQYHPLLGSILLEKFDNMHDAALVALHHHRFYDENGGYLNDCPHCQKAVKHFVDIVTVCDALDAATDNVGRSYATAKTLDKLLSELRAGCGVRYSPEVVRLFDDADFCRQIESILNNERQAIYCRIYSNLRPPRQHAAS